MKLIEVKVVKKKLVSLILASQMDNEMNYGDGTGKELPDYDLVVKLFTEWLDEVERE